MDTPKERAVKMALTAAVQQSRTVGRAIDAWNKRHRGNATIGGFFGTLDQGILVPQADAQQAITAMTQTLINCDIAPAGSFKIEPISVDPALDQEMGVTQIAVTKIDWKKVNITKAAQFIRLIESMPMGSVSAGTSTFRFN